MKNILGLLLLITSGLNAQVLDFKVQWGTQIPDNVNENIPKSLCAEHIYYGNNIENTPVFIQQIPLNLPVKLDDYKITITDSSELNTAEYTYLKNRFKGQIEEKTALYGAGKNNKTLQVKITPLLKNKDRIYKINSFSISLETSTEYGLKSSTANTSLLAEGNWYKFRIRKSGIYKLTYDDIRNLGFENPANVSLFGNGGAMLPKYNAEQRKTDLQEIPVYIEKGNDNIFNNGDYILCYLEGPVTWAFNPDEDVFKQTIHAYSNYAYYFLTDNQSTPSTHMEKNISGTAQYTTDSYDAYSYYEHERINLISSGRLFFSKKLESGSNADTTFYTPNRIVSEPAIIKTAFAGRSSNGCNLDILVNSEEVATLYAGSVAVSNSQYNYAAYKSNISSVNVNEQNITVGTKLNKSSSGDEAWLDYITLNYRAELTLNTDYLVFTDADMPSTAVSAFTLSGADGNTEVWNITDLNQAYKLSGTLSGSSLTVKDQTDSIEYYVALKTGGNFPSPEFEAQDDDLGFIENQDLRSITGCELLIVTHPDFMHQAEELASIHRNKDNLNVCMIPVQQVYNDYSSGKPDVAAIRDFVKELYDSGDSFKYLLLFGDGSVNNLIRHKKNPNFIPTYESRESLYQSNSYVTDDFFGFLDDNEGEAEGTIDIGIGRIPVGDTLEGRVVLDKIYSHYNNLVSAKWNNNITFIGDDEDGNVHMSQANQVSNMVENYKPEFAIQKIFIDAYEQITTASGSRYPEVNEAIDQAMLKGQLIVNYSGHGGIRGLAHERIVTLEQIDNWTNRNKYPIFVTATCELSAFDHIDDNFQKIEKTAGEKMFLKEDGGALAMLTTTRLVYSGANLALNTAFYNTVFNRDDNGNYYRLGDVIKETKRIYPATNTLKFALLGDPALPLPFANHTVVTDSINAIAVPENDTVMVDTVLPLNEMHISGHIENYFGEKLNNYNGIVYVTVYDKERTVTTRANDNNAPFSYKVHNDLLFNGKASVTDGNFRLTFITPKDMSISKGQGKISYFATDSITSASGYYKNFIIGGISSGKQTDNLGPEINLSINDTAFTDGGITNQSPRLIGTLSDESGINVSNYGVGHDIIAYLDGDPTDLYVLNDYYEADIDEYKSGTLNFPLQNLSEGYHTITVRAWDVYNNVSETSIAFTATSNESLIIENLNTYPNPFNDYVYFVFDHNFAEEELDVLIEIFDINGRKVEQLHKETLSEGFSTAPIRWNAASSGFLPEGVYIYRAEIKPKNSNKSIILHNKIIKTR